MFQFLNFLEKIWESYGAFYVILIVISIIVLWFIKKELLALKESYDEALKNIKQTNEEIVKFNNHMESIIVNLDEKCNLSQCPQFHEINTQLSNFKQDVKEFKIDIKNSLNSLTEYAKDRMEIIAKDGKNTNEQLLALIRTFINKSFD